MIVGDLCRWQYNCRCHTCHFYHWTAANKPTLCDVPEDSPLFDQISKATIEDAIVNHHPARNMDKATDLQKLREECVEWHQRLHLQVLSGPSSPLYNIIEDDKTSLAGALCKIQPEAFKIQPEAFPSLDFVDIKKPVKKPLSFAEIIRKNHPSDVKKYNMVIGATKLKDPNALAATIIRTFVSQLANEDFTKLVQELVLGGKFFAGISCEERAIWKQEMGEKLSSI